VIARSRKRARMVFVPEAFEQHLGIRGSAHRPGETDKRDGQLAGWRLPSYLQIEDLTGPKAIDNSAAHASARGRIAAHQARSKHPLQHAPP
jgi:hypothetical protein